jgi:PAS domain S-box-containing protein
METLTPARLVSLFDQFPLGLVLLEATGEVIFANQNLAGMTGTETFELIGQGFYDVLFPSSDVNARVRSKALSALEAPFDDLDLTVHKGRDEKVTLHVSGGRIADNGAGLLVLVVQDITHRKAFEKVIESSFDNFIQVTNALDAATKKLGEQNTILENYKDKMTHELEIAKSVQKAIIPTRFPDVEGLDMYGLSIPSDELGGDYFDWFQLDASHIGILIADVSGHGVPSSLITTMVKATFEYYTKRFLEPEKVLSHVNHDMAVIITDTGFYLTALYAVLNLETKVLRVSVAGHDSALCWNPSSGTLRRLGEGCEGTILGVFSDATYSALEYQLEPGSQVLLFTDGITEARSDKGEFFGNARLEDFLRQSPPQSSFQTVTNLVAAVDAFYGTNLPNDDRTLVVFDLKSGERELARHEFRSRNFESALALVEQVLETGADALDLRLLAGQACAHLGRDREAARHFEKAIGFDPRSPKSWYYLGLVRYNLGQLPLARQAWEQVLTVQSDYKDTVGLLARINRS